MRGNAKGESARKRTQLIVIERHKATLPRRERHTGRHHNSHVLNKRVNAARGVVLLLLGYPFYQVSRQV